jgi:hypothetical protein
MVKEIEGRGDGDFEQNLQDALVEFANDGWRLHNVIESLSVFEKSREDIEFEVRERIFKSSKNMIGDCYLIFEREVQD